MPIQVNQKAGGLGSYRPLCARALWMEHLACCCIRPSCSGSGEALHTIELPDGVNSGGICMMRANSANRSLQSHCIVPSARATEAWGKHPGARSARSLFRRQVERVYSESLCFALTIESGNGWLAAHQRVRIAGRLGTSHVHKANRRSSNDQAIKPGANCCLAFNYVILSTSHATVLLVRRSDRVCDQCSWLQPSTLALNSGCYHKNAWASHGL